MQQTIQTGSHNVERKPQTHVGAELNLLTVVLPARDEEGCIASTVEHLHQSTRTSTVSNGRSARAREWSCPRRSM
jgi:hypothetical protein